MVKGSRIGARRGHRGGKESFTPPCPLCAPSMLPLCPEPIHQIIYSLAE